MKIGIFISPAYSVPPAEKIILAPWVLARDLTDGLILHGNEVHIFCAEGSKTRGIQHSFGITPTAFIKQTMPFFEYRAFVREKEHELFHHAVDVVKKDHINVLHIYQKPEFIMDDLIAQGTSICGITTFHDPIVKDRWGALQEIQKKTKNAYVSVSDAQRKNVPLDFIATVYHGISVSSYAFEKEVDEELSRFLIVGRIVPEKGFSDAIQAILKTKGKLMILGQVYTDQSESLRYFTEHIQPYVDQKNIFRQDVVSPELVTGHYQTAKALLFPIHWEEPFGMAMIESMACGTPVIAYARGSVPEVIVDGVTGFIVNESEEERRGDWITKKTGVEGLVEAITRLDTMPKDEYTVMRRACRKHVEEKFTVEKMVEGYERVYEKILSQWA